MTNPAREQERQDEFVALLGQHQRILFKVANAYCRLPEDRRDLEQEITVQLWRAFPSFDARARFSTWMYRIALNVAISFRRRDRVRARHVLPARGELLEIADPSPPPSPDDETDKLWRLIHAFPGLDRALLLLWLDGHDHAAIGEILGLSATNVGTRIHRLKQRLRERFDRDSA
jgi:RNA polymerase sigma-70 factor (ECF subfamily)